MKLAGSATIKIRCRGCNKLSEAFKIYLYWKDGEKVWDVKSLPENWEIDEEAMFFEDPEAETIGLCPDCLRQEMPGDE